MARNGAQGPAVFHPRADVVQCQDGLANLGQQIAAVAGQLDARAGAQEETRAERLLQRLHMLRDGGLADAESLGGSRKAAMGGNGMEGAELGEIHGMS
jgi:hypothetical protein